jgi:hypothetical protein
MKKLTLVSIVILCFSSCAQIFNGTVLPNQCKKCELINMQTNEVLFENEGCGSENTNLEEQAQIKAYEMSRHNNKLCDLEVRCESWRKDPEDEK